jgi:large subunit ribosomal protein L17
MATSLIMHKRITTTLAKAKALRVYVEPIITRSKDDTTHSRRVVFSHLQSKEAVTELFRDISSKVAERPGGYTRIIKLGQRLGDNAEMAMIELVDFNLNLLGEKSAAKAKGTRRGRRGPAKKVTEETVASAPEVKTGKAKTKKGAEPVAPVKPTEPAEPEVPEAPENEVEDVGNTIEETGPVAESEEPSSEETPPEEPQSEEEPKA